MTKNVPYIKLTRQYRDPSVKLCRLTDGHWRQGGEEKVVEHQVHLVDHDGAGESAEQLIPEAYKHEGLK